MCYFPFDLCVSFPYYEQESCMIVFAITMPNQHVNTPQCSRCGLKREQFHQVYQSSTGRFAKHCNLCLDNDASGNAISHAKCFICEEDLSLRSDDAIYGHYKKNGQNINQTQIIHDVHREFCPHEYPDLDFNQDYH